MPSQGTCFFSGLSANVETLPNHDGISIEVSGQWNYWLSGLTQLVFTSENPLSEKEKFLCLQETIKLNQANLTPFWNPTIDHEESQDPRVILKSIDDISSNDINHTDKDKKIIDLLAQKLKGHISQFDCVKLDLKDRYSIGIFKDQDLFHWIVHLHDQGLLGLDEVATLNLGYPDQSLRLRRLIDRVTTYASIGLTVNGWDYVHSLRLGKKSKKVFVAMAFTDQQRREVSPELREKIRECLERDDKWEAIITDEVEHNDGIMDKTIAAINESRFIISELTHQKSGVYYEAGYAKGFGLPVIHIVKKNDLENCHFDVKHLNLITWETFEELDRKLTNRINATIV